MSKAGLRLIAAAREARQTRTLSKYADDKAVEDFARVMRDQGLPVKS